jgi:hypothetical protein
MEQIRELFQHSKDFGLAHDDMNEIMFYLAHITSEFRSVAYEAVSMSLALRDFKKDESLSTWKSFMQGPAAVYISQVHVGLGWAISQENQNLKHLPAIDHLMVPRVIDGCGYYDGLFRSRQTIKIRKLPEQFTDTALSYYDQGVGRSIWYSCLGNPEKVKEIITQFDTARQSALWRGIGIAAAFVGGCDEKKLTELFFFSGNYRTQLATGVAIASRERVKSNSVTPDIELACGICWNRSANEITALSENLLPSEVTEGSYTAWITALEKSFITSDLINQ